MTTGLGQRPQVNFKLTADCSSVFKFKSAFVMPAQHKCCPSDIEYAINAVLVVILILVSLVFIGWTVFR